MRSQNRFSMGLLAASVILAADPHATPTGGPSPDAALEWLKFGNERHVAGKPVHWHQSVDRRLEVAKGQAPHAIILSCSDSRVPPELVFDQGLGDLFVVRVAGNVVGEKELGSIEYAAEHLHAPLVVVMGHQRCGALQAAVGGGPVPGHIGSLLSSLSAAVSRSKGMPGDSVDNAVHSNVDHQVGEILHSEPLLAHLVAEKKIKVVGAYYNLDTGAVEWHPETPSPVSQSLFRVTAQKH